MTRSSFDNLRDASFRGAPFEVDTNEYAGGRRLARHEYPLRDTPFAEDLGRKAGEYPVEAFIVQGRKYEYAGARDQLMRALDDYGPATLIHPSLGELTVAVDGYRLKESSREGGYCTFSITFVEAGQAENPGATRNTAQTGAARVAAARSASLANFLRRYLALPQWLDHSLAAFADGVESACLCLDLAYADLAPAVVIAQGMILDPVRLGGAMGDLFPADMLAERSRYYDFTPLTPLLEAGFDAYLFGPDPYVSPGRTLAAEVATQAVITASEAAMLADYAAADDAMAARDAVLAGLDLAAEFAPDALFGPLVDLRLAVAVDLTTRGGMLPRIAHTELSATQPALVAAYKIYGDAGRDAEIARRNRVRHPGRVPGGVPLEVLL